VADVGDFTTWSSTAASNAPSGASVIGSGLDDNLRQIQAEVAKWRDGTGYGILTVTSVSGANSITGSTSPVPALVANQKFMIVPASTNTGSVSIALNGGSFATVLAGTGNCVGGEFDPRTPVLLEYDGTHYNIVGVTNVISNKTFDVANNTFNCHQITNSLSGNVSLNNTTTYFDGPSVAQGTSGTWFVSGTVTVSDSNGDAGFAAKLWDGTTVIASAFLTTRTANTLGVISLSGSISSPAANVRISVKDISSTGGSINSNSSGAFKDSTITAIRIG